MTKRSYQMYIGGERVAASDGKTSSVYNPSTEEIVAEVPRATIADVRQALKAAESASREWGMLPAIERASYLKKIADVICKNQESLAKTVVMEQGKTLLEARGEVQEASDIFGHCAGFVPATGGDVLSPERKDELTWIMKAPFGVVVGILPWNYPAAMFSVKVAPALIAGNTIVVKPSSLTPTSALEIMDLINEEVGLPKGVLNVVTGISSDIGEELVGNPICKMVSVTGEVETGKRIMEIASRNVTKVSLELGGKAPFVVWKDANLDLAVKCAIATRFINCGQDCTANERMYIHEDIIEEFLKKFVREAEGIRVGDPMNPDTEMGPLISAEQREKVESFVKNSVAKGAKTVAGGKSPEGAEFEKGYWYSPTVVTNVRQEMEIMQKEIFGPVVPVMSVSNLDETISLCNDSRYGLGAYAFSEDVGTIMRMIRGMNFGELFINMTGMLSWLQGYHAGWRESGLGGDGGKYGLEEYLQKKSVYLRHGGLSGLF